MVDTRRRHGRWSEDFKRRVVAEAAASELSASEIARRNGLNPNLVFNWRKKFGADQQTTGNEVCLLPVELKATSDETLVKANGFTSGSIEIILPCGSQLRCDNDTNSVLLSQALLALKPNNPCTVP